MDWKTASALYANRLKSALDLQRHTLDLLNLATVNQIGSFNQEKQVLRNIAAPTEKLMHRLQQGEFRIAVVGLEKAGKSTFVNAWLGSDLLPAKTARCTFTTTQIYSVLHDADQRLETIPKDVRQYQDYQHSLEEQKNSPDKGSAQKAENDLRVMQEHQKTLQEIINEGRKTQQFNKLDEVKESLIRYVADERYAHAMQEARLYTSKLAAVDGVVFYDVPGLDSGLNKHIEESKEMLSDCDAIILVQRLDIDLKAHEQDLIKFGKDGDPYLSLADKLFVFWGQIDLQPSKEVLDERWEELLRKWEAFDIPAHRLVRGSAGAHLVLQGVHIPQVGSFETIKHKMQTLIGTDDLEALKNETGINKLKELIKNYLDQERVGLLEKRCNQIVADIVEISHSIYKKVSEFYPENPEEAKKIQENSNRIEFHQWWDQRWEKIRADVNNYFYEQKKQNNLASIFRSRYEELIREKIAALPSRQIEQREQIFDSASHPVFDAARANFEWRQKLYSDVRKMVADISGNLAYELKQQALELIAILEGKLWNSKSVKAKLIKQEEEYLRLLEHSLHTLFLRFVRPIVDVLVRAPVGSDTRKETRESIGADIEIIDNYYSGEEPALKRLRQYANHGFYLLVDDEKRKEVLGKDIASALDSIISANVFGQIGLATAKTVVDTLEEKLETKKEGMISEVEADIRVLEHYLIFGTFDASGFNAFCQQELENIRDSFLDITNKSYWIAVVENEWCAGNKALLSELPINLRSFDFNIETSERLRQLGISLTSMKTLI